jgi:hypothetical protein
MTSIMNLESRGWIQVRFSQANGFMFFVTFRTR